MRVSPTHKKYFRKYFVKSPFFAEKYVKSPFFCVPKTGPILYVLFSSKRKIGRFYKQGKKYVYVYKVQKRPIFQTLFVKFVFFFAKAPIYSFKFTFVPVPGTIIVGVIEELDFLFDSPQNHVSKVVYYYE